jgi:hypothetical protein
MSWSHPASHNGSGGLPRSSGTSEHVADQVQHVPSGRNPRAVTDVQVVLAVRDEEQSVGLPLHYLFGAIPLGSAD